MTTTWDPSLDDVECTCFPINAHEHDTDCELWLNPGFRDGTRVWHSYYGLCDPDDLDAWLEDDRIEEHMIQQQWLDDYQGIAWSSTDTIDDAEVVDDYDPTGVMCTCPAEYQADLVTKTDGIFDNHLDGCGLAEYTPWKLRLCEWDPSAKELRWYYSFDTPGKTRPTGKTVPFNLADRIAEAENPTTSSGTSYSGYSTWTKDRHDQTPVVLIDETVVYASSAHQRKAGDPIPDHGLYLDPTWRPDSIATFIPWRDHGLPEVRYDHAITTIVEHFELARDGWTVEVGCIGGHGRTGTVLACWAVLAGTPADEAVEWVRANYCKHAIESDSQEWFVLYFASKVHDTPTPPPIVEIYGTGNPKPPPPPPKKVEAVKCEPVKKTGMVTTMTPAEFGWRCLGCQQSMPKHSTYLCSNNKCTNYNVVASSPRGKKLLRRWGRKK